MGLFGAPHGWGGQKDPPSLKLSDLYYSDELGTLIPKEIQKIYESRYTPLEFC